MVNYLLDQLLSFYCSEISRIATMFTITHEKYLKESIWEPPTTGRAEYIEVGKYAGVCNILIGHSVCKLTWLAYTEGKVYS